MLPSSETTSSKEGIRSTTILNGGHGTTIVATDRHVLRLHAGGKRSEEEDGC